MAKKTRQPKGPEQAAGPKRGPQPDALIIESAWDAAVRKALQKKRPKKGWPKAKPKKGK